MNLGVATYDSGCSDLIRHQNTERVPVEPSHSKAKRLGHIASSEVAHSTTLDGHVCGDLDDRRSNAENESSHDEIGDQQKARSSLVEDLARANKETCSDSAACLCVSRLWWDLRWQAY